MHLGLSASPKYEVTIQQYTDFLNAVAKSDPYQLYNPNMATDLSIAGIARSGSPGSFHYSVIGPAGVNPVGARSPGNRPVSYVSWFDAARFANWMHNGRGSGSTETGAYTLNGVTTGKAVSVNAGARFNIPSINEWYKAAYYSRDLNDGKGGYYVFPTQSDSTPGSIPGNNINRRNSPNQANYFTGGFSVTQTIIPSFAQNYLTDVGAFANSASYYGTFDQAGNVYEWIDDQGPLTQRSLRGGYFVSNVADTSYLDAYILPPDYESNGSGIRLASRQKLSATQDSANLAADPLTGQHFTRGKKVYPNRYAATNITRNRFSGREVIASAFQDAPLQGDHTLPNHDIFRAKDLRDLFANDFASDHGFVIPQH